MTTTKKVRITFEVEFSPAEGETIEDLEAFIRNDPKRPGMNPGPVGAVCYSPMTREWAAAHGTTIEHTIEVV